MSENKTFGVKVPENLHTEATELMKKLNLTGEGFLNELVNVYKSEKAKEDIPMIAQDLQTLQVVQQRISNIYLNMAYRIQEDTINAENKKREELTNKDSIITDLQNEIKGLNIANEKFILAFKNNEEDKEMLEKQVNQLSDTIQSKNELMEANKNLIEEYKNKNDMLLSDLAEYKKYKTEIEEFKQKLQDTEYKLKGSNIDLEDYKKRVVNGDLKIEKLKEEHEDYIASLETIHEKALEDQESILAFEHEKALLQKDKEHQQQINKLNEENNKKINTLLNEKEKINDKISKLMEDNQMKNNVLDMKTKELIIEIEALKNTNKAKIK